MRETGFVSHFRVVTQDLWKVEPDGSACLRNAISYLRTSIESIAVMPALEKKSTSVKRAIFRTSVESGSLKWQKTPITDSEMIQSLGVPSAIYHLDGTWDCGGICGISHCINFVVCLNNRETIGTNFLKLEIANRFRISTGPSGLQPLGLLITFQRELLDFGGWDPAYADSYEYRQAYRRMYEPILDGPFASIEITTT